MAKQGKVLVVDDEPDIARLLVMLLESEGYPTTLATSGKEALDLAAKLKPAVVVLDLSLPDVDGPHVLRRLKARRETAGIPVIVVSAYIGRLTAADRALLHAIFEKPFSLDDLVEAVEQVYGGDHKDAIPASSRQRPAPSRAISVA